MNTDRLLAVLLEARDEGLVGPGLLQTHLDHARGFAQVLDSPSVFRSGTEPVFRSGTEPGATLLDLGSGAGLPGLVLALLWPTSRWVLLDGRARSADFLRKAVRKLDLERRVKVVGGRAEEVAHDSTYRQSVQVVVARSVASPAVVAECAAGFLVSGGLLVVSEPPESQVDRWVTTGLARLGMGQSRAVETTDHVHFSVIEQRLPCPAGFPRRTGVPARRPLF